MDPLPTEIVFHIMSFLSVKELLRKSCLSKFFREICNNEFVFHEYATRFNILNKNSTNTWKQTIIHYLKKIDTARERVFEIEGRHYVSLSSDAVKNVFSLLPDILAMYWVPGIYLDDENGEIILQSASVGRFLYVSGLGVEVSYTDVENNRFFQLPEEKDSLLKYLQETDAIRKRKEY